MLLHFGTHALAIEVDEVQHDSTPCWDEDVRLDVIAADVQVPLAVLRLRVDAPEQCFSSKRLKNGETVLTARSGPFERLVARGADALDSLSVLSPNCSDAVRLVVLDGVAG
jgi:hypothetical protein